MKSDVERKYGVVLVGCGQMGAMHLDEIYNNKRIQLIGVVDVKPESAKVFYHKYCAQSWSTTYEEYLLREEVHIFIICTYPSTHFSIASQCLEAGKHILCEKPMAADIEQAEAFHDIAAKARTKVMFGHILRHNATYIKVAEMIHSGMIGSPLAIRMSQTKRVNQGWQSYLNLLEDVSPIVDCGVHYIDVMRWYTHADVKYVSGIGQRLDMDVPIQTYNYGIITLKFTDDSVGYYEAGWSRNISTNNLKEFIGPKGRINIIYQIHRPEADRHLGNLIQYESYENNIRQEINVNYHTKPTGAQFEYFIKMIEDDMDHVPFLEDVYRSLQQVILGHRSILEGRTFTVLDGCKKIEWNSENS